MGSFTPPPTTSLTPGDRLDRYELLCVLAQGGMGTVWLARMTGKLGFERLVALKTILPSYTNDRQFCDMFLDEARIAAQIDHENVARILEIGEDRGLLYYAMELIDGEALRKIYRDVRAANAVFPMGVALRVAADACAGLHATHELRGEDGMPLEVVHRDVSPQNLLITIRGTTKLIDFGVAKARARRSEDTAAGTLKGKIEFMAPEQARGEPLDRRADIYSIGAVLYELLAGRPVRDTEDGKQLAALHELLVGAPYAPLPAYVPDIVRQIVDRALAQDPRHRFSTADELRRALEQAMVATGQAATTEDVANVLGHFSRERTAKRRDAMDRALRASTEGRLNAATIVAPISSQHMAHAQVPPVPMSSRPGMEPVTGPSLRTMQGASFTNPPPPSSAGKVMIGVIVLAGVALLGVGAGVVMTKRVPSLTAVTPLPPAASASVSVAAPEPAPPLIPAVGTAEPASPATGVVASASPPAPASSSAPRASASSAHGKHPPAGQPPRGPTRIGPKPTGEPDDYGF